MYHALTGCDTTSSFRERGKKSTWLAWQSYSEVTETLSYLVEHPFHPLDASSPHFKKLERLAIIIYDKTSPLENVNEARLDIFCHKNRTMDKLPPTQVIKIIKHYDNLLKVLFFGQIV